MILLIIIIIIIKTVIILINAFNYHKIVEDFLKLVFYPKLVNLFVVKREKC
jgi:hypothetical protein